MKLTKKIIKAELLARNEWFYDYTMGRISIGKLRELIAQAIMDLRKED